MRRTRSSARVMSGAGRRWGSTTVHGARYWSCTFWRYVSLTMKYQCISQTSFRRGNRIVSRSQSTTR